MDKKTCSAVNTIIFECGRLNPSIHVRPLKLQKLLYFCFGWCLVKCDTILFRESFEAWPYGPVVASVYHHFKRYGYNCIETFATSYDGISYRFKDGVTDKNLLNTMRICINRYNRLDDLSLANLTHRNGMAWWRTREEKLRQIPMDYIESEFSSLKNEEI